MAKPDLVFITKENEGKVKAIAEGNAGARCKSCGTIVTGPHECPGPFAEDEVKTDETIQDASAAQECPEPPRAG